MSEFKQQWNEFADRVHRIAVNAGWWNPGKSDVECVALMHTELSEAIEALREPIALQDVKCPDFKNLEVELADVVLRIMDFAVQRGLDVPGAIEAKHAYNATRSFRHGNKKY